MINPMGWFLILVLAALTVGSLADETEPEDLGVITDRRAVILESPYEVSDFRHFTLDFMPMVPPTNKITLVLTNGILTLSNLAALPSGRMVLGLRSTCLDGSESAVKLYRLTIRRGDPPKPTAKVITLIRGSAEETNITERALIRVREMRPVVPPPPFPGEQPQAMKYPSPPPLPRSTNETYAQSMDRMAAHYARLRKKD